MATNFRYIIKYITKAKYYTISIVNRKIKLDNLFKLWIQDSVMPAFLDIHKVSSITESKMQELLNLPSSDIRTINICYNVEADLCYCLFEAPSKESIERHHAKLDLKCNLIIEVTMVKSDFSDD